MGALKVLTFIPLIVGGAEYIMNYLNEFFIELVKLLFIELCGMELTEKEIKLLADKFKKVFEKDNKKLGRIGAFQLRRKHFKIIKKLGKLRNFTEKEVFIKLLKNGKLGEYFENIEKIMEFYKIMKRTNLITNKTWNFINSTGIENEMTIREKNELFYRTFLLLQNEENTDIEKLFSETIKEYENSEEYRNEMRMKQAKLIALLTKASMKVKSKKERNELSNFITLIENIELETLFKMEEEGNENDSERSFIHSAINSNSIKELINNTMGKVNEEVMGELIKEEKKMKEHKSKEVSFFGV